MQCRKGFECWSCGFSFWWIWTSYMPNASKSLGEPASSLQQVWLELWRRGERVFYLSTVLMIEVEIYFRWEHVGPLSLLDFHLQQIWPGTLSTDELRRALCGVGLKTADAPQRNRAPKPWKTWKHDEPCGRVVWQCIWALDSESNCFVALRQVVQVTKIYKVMVTGLEFCAASLVFFKTKIGERLTWAIVYCM